MPIGAARTKLSEIGADDYGDLVMFTYAISRRIALNEARPTVTMLSMRALIPPMAASALGVAAACAVGCGSSGGPGTPPPPLGPSLPGVGVVEWGVTPCTGVVYYPDGSGYAICEGGVWEYTVELPSCYACMASSGDGGCS